MRACTSRRTAALHLPPGNGYNDFQQVFMKTGEIKMKNTMFIVVFLVAAGAVFAADRHVPGTYPSIQAAFNSASSGDRIVVAAGTFTGVENAQINFQGKVVEVSGQGPGSTIIDGQNTHKGFYFLNNTVNGSRVTGVTIRNCTSDFVGGMGLWSGASVTVENCRIENCTGTAGGAEGGGIRIYESSAVISDVTITGCSAAYGGGINVLNNAQMTLTNALIEDCTGGAVYIAQSCNAVIDDCMIRNNVSSSSSYMGGVSVYQQSTLTMKRSWIMYNRNIHSGGGGIHIENGSYADIQNCLIAGNTAAVGGGALLFRVNGSADIVHCTIVDNDADANDDAVYIENSAPKFKNCIVWNENAGMEFNPAWAAQGNVIYCDVRGGVPGIGNIQVDPDFLGGGTYHLSKDSPCIDAGISAGIDVDIDGEFRPAGMGFDMGADEFHTAPQITVDLVMPAVMYHPGDTFQLTMDIVNAGDAVSNVPVFCLLNVGAEYFFWPDWDDFSYENHNIPASNTLTLEILPAFSWPSGTGSASGIQFLGACTNASMTALLGTMDTVTFGWSD